MNLRITHQDEDFTFQVLKKGPITKDTTEIQVLLEGQTYTLLKNRQQWHCLAELNLPGQELIEAIGKALALRYRI